MTIKPKVSVIMAEYNTSEDYLRVAIKSILDQTFRAFEFIIVDDGGSNDVQAITDEFHDTRIRVVKNSKNKGLIFSLNRAIAEARTDYLVRMDTDDIAMPERIDRLYNFMQLHPEYAVVGSRVMEFSADGDTGLLSSSGEKEPKQIMRGDAPIHPSVIMRRSIVRDVGGYRNYKRAEDLALWCEMLIGGSRIYVINEVLLKYRVNKRDYAKRTLRHRGGELKARWYYYPKMHAGLIEYMRILKSVIAGILPAVVMRKMRSITMRAK